jgi:hypothetical protein
MLVELTANELSGISLALHRQVLLSQNMGEREARVKRFQRLYDKIDALYMTECDGYLTRYECMKAIGEAAEDPLMILY